MENMSRENLYTITINDNGANLYIREFNGLVSYVYDDSLSFLVPVTKVLLNGDVIEVFIFTKKYFSIDNGIINRYSLLSSTEVRNIGMMLSNENDDYTKNEAHFNRSGLMIDGRVNTELHTHLIEILTSNGFLDFINKFNGEVLLNESGVIDFRNGSPFNVDQIRSLPQLHSMVLEQLEIPINRTGDFEELERKVENRTRMLLGIADKYSVDTAMGDMDSSRVLVTKVLLHDSLVYLRDSNVKYVEVSHSNVRIINRVLDSLDEEFFNDISGIQFRFLISSSRLKSAKDFRQSGRYLEAALENQAVVGFDIMGLESKFSEADLDINSRDSLYRKIYPILSTLSKYNNSVLRLHSGEFVDTDANTEQLLEVLLLIEKELGIRIPPPEIRIGHGLHINQNDRLVSLIKHFDCIVEINASSNFALGNVTDLSEIPYKFYLDNGIKVVVSTDGGGFYKTSSEQEKYIAKTFIGNDDLDRLFKCDEEIYQNKIGGVIHDKSAGR